MNYFEMSDKAIGSELGGRIRSLRLRRNMSQQQLSDAVSISLNSIKSLEGGKGKLSTIIAVLREFQALEHLDGFIPEVTISPLQLAKMQGRQRQRASGIRGKKADKKKASEW